MKKNYILTLVSLLTLTGCNRAKEDYTNVNHQIKRLDFNEDEKHLVLKSKNKTNIASSKWSARYSKEGIYISVDIEDVDIYKNNIYDIGYDDNIEFIINNKSTTSGWMVNKTYHFLLSANGKSYFQVANSKSSFGRSYDPKLGVVRGENLDYTLEYTNSEEHGYDGYKCKIFLSYDVLGSTYKESNGNLSICLGMRNSHTYLADTNWSAYDQRGCTWANSNTFVLINSDGTFGEKIKQDVDVMFVGDNLFNSSSWSTYDLDLANKTSINISSANNTFESISLRLKDYSLCTSKDIFVNLGNNDLVGNSKEIIVSKTKELLTTLKTTYTGATIHYVSLIGNPSLVNELNKIKEINQEIETYVATSGIDYVDIFNLFILDNSYRVGLFNNNNLNYLGYNLLSRTINETLNNNVNNLPSIFKGNSSYASSSSFNEISENDINVIEGNGAKDQYLFFNSEPAIDVSFTLDVTVLEVYNNDNYPKFGLVLLSETDTLFFYVDGSQGLTRQNVGYVRGKNHTNWQWASSIEKGVNISYNNNQYVVLAIEKVGSVITLKVNNDVIFTVNDFFGNEEKLSAGFLSFNTHTKIKNY